MVQERQTYGLIRRKGAWSWLDVRGRRLGAWAFALNRLTGLGLVLYLVIHLLVLSLLTQGESRWNDFIALAKSPAFLFLDVVLFFGLLFHGLNGIRVALVGMGLGVERHKTLFWVLMTIGAVLLLLSAWKVFSSPAT